MEVMTEDDDDAGIIVELATPPNTGKTLMAAALAMACPNMKIVFCCVVPGVFLHVARLWYFLGFYPTFVYGNKRVEPSFKLSRVSWDPYSTQTLRDYFRSVIPKARCFIVDMNLCQWFVEQLDPNTTLLFLDEPTMGCDGCDAFAHVPHLIARLFQSPSIPRRVIVSSATLPSTQELGPLTGMWTNKYPDGRIVRIDHTILTSSISIIESESGHMVLPHAYCRWVNPPPFLGMYIF